MKLVDLYTDWRVVTGVALSLLGAGNWIIGLSRAQEYREIVTRASSRSLPTDYRVFDEIGDTSGGAVLAPLTAEQKRVSYAAARMDFYHATFLTGRVIVALGLALTLWGFLATIRRDARFALTRAARGGPGPPLGRW